MSNDHYEKIRRVLAREICGECDSPINDDGTCDCTELLKRGWRQCANGQKVTQWCAEAERIRGELREQRQRDDDLLRQALKALEQGAWDTLRGRNAAAAIRERLGGKV